MPGSDTEVVVVGGGAAGVAAGRRLRDASVDCLIVEARSRLGGRSWTITDAAGFALDLGCGWLHSADRNPWVKVAEGQGRVIDKATPPWGRPSMTAGFPLEEQREFNIAMDAFHERVEQAAETEADGPASALLEPGNRWNNLINSVGTYISGMELDQISIRDLANYADSGVNWRVTDGYGTIIAAHGASVPMVLDSPVSRIDHSGPRLRIETPKGVITADQAIITLPTTVLAEQDDFFAPALPEKTEAAAGLPLGLDDKLFMALEGAEEFDLDSRIFGRTDRSGTGAYHARPFGRPQIEAFYGGALAAELEAGGEAAFFDFAVAELTGLFGSGFARRLKFVAVHPWGTDPFARGAYSCALPGRVDCRAVLAAPVNDRLFFAGEACSRHDYSTAHGGWLTGVAAADQVIAVRKGRPIA